jgi:cyclase
MLYKRLIPKIVVDNNGNQAQSGFNAILTRVFGRYRVIGEPLSQIRVQQSNLVDEIMLVHRNRESFDSSFCDLVLKTCELLTTPLTVGGAVSAPEHVRRIFESGADKIVIGRNRGNLPLLEEVATNHGIQSLVISVDFTDDDLSLGIDKFLEKELSLGYFQLAGEVCLNNISRDGGGCGVDLRLVGSFKSVTSAPIVVGCGVANVSHLVECFQAGSDAVTLSTYLSHTDQSIRQIRSHLSARGVHIRTKD